MRISAIQHYENPRTISKQKCVRNHQGLKTTPESEPIQDTVAFKGYTAKGAGLGALIGIGAVALISGGLATPIAYGIYAATMGTAGGMLGHAIDDVNEEEKKKKP